MLKKIKFSDQIKNKYIDEYILGNVKNNKNVSSVVSGILRDIKINGDKALIKLIKKYENKNIKKDTDIFVSENEIIEARKSCSKKLIQALSLSIKRVSSYQKKLLPKDIKYLDSSGMKLGCLWRPINSCGLYVPGGKAIYPSSVIMNAVPAKLAGVKRIIIMTPAKDNIVSPEILAAADLLGINEIYKVGGAQAIGAMTFGTNNINKVDKIVGPGNAFVAEAKKQVYGIVGIDSVAGPSEIMVVADKSCNPEWVAIDLLSQAEHDEDARVILVTDSNEIANKINQKIKINLAKITRKKIAKSSLKNNGIAIIISDIENAYKIVNLIAPEHLELITKKNQALIKKITNAGAIFAGNYTPESLGDYLAGPSHVLPTSGNARFESGLSVLDFFKRTSYIEADRKSLKNFAKSIDTIAKSEGLDAHALAATTRFNKS